MRLKTILIALIVALLLPAAAEAQFRAVAVRAGASDPTTCQPSGTNIFLNTTTDTLKVCTASATWSALVDSATADADYFNVTGDQITKVLGAEEVTDTVAAWDILGAGWSVSDTPQIELTGVLASSDAQNSTATVVAGIVYELTYTYTRTAGTLTPSLGGDTGGTVSAAGPVTVTEWLTATATTALAFTGVGFSGTVYDVSAKPITSTVGVDDGPLVFDSPDGFVFIPALPSGTGDILADGSVPFTNTVVTIAGTSDTPATRPTDDWNGSGAWWESGFLNIGNNGVQGGLKTASITLGSTAITVTAAEWNYLSGVTSAVQTQLDAKLAKAGGTMTGNLLFTDNTLDIGAAGATRPRTGYFGTEVVTPSIDSGAAVNLVLQYNGVTAAAVKSGNLSAVTLTSENDSAFPGTTRGFLGNTSGAAVQSDGRYGFSASAVDVGGATDTNYARHSAGVGVLRDDTASSVRALLGGGAAVASATALPLPTGRVFHVTGTTPVTSITSTNFEDGVVITLIFDDALTFTDGSNLKLAGDFVTTADDTLTLAYDGTSWFEIGRSVN